MTSKGDQQLKYKTSSPEDLKSPSFKEWLSDRNITFIIITILMIYALEKFLKNLHSNIISPTFDKCLTKIGYHAHEKHLHSKLQKVLIDVLELVVVLILLFFISRFIFKHKRTTNIIEQNKTFINSKEETTTRNFCKHCSHCRSN